MQIGLDQEPDILVFYINRFDQSGKSTKKNVMNVAVPLELTGKRNKTSRWLFGK
uniref:Uncharacterized protein n=1 Tax=Meloidogyne javanica TaxID=6303 RepID=A0A915MYB4_MELJA